MEWRGNWPRQTEMPNKKNAHIHWHSYVSILVAAAVRLFHTYFVDVVVVAVTIIFEIEVEEGKTNHNWLCSNFHDYDMNHSLIRILMYAQGEQTKNNGQMKKHFTRHSTAMCFFLAAIAIFAFLGVFIIYFVSYTLYYSLAHFARCVRLYVQFSYCRLFLLAELIFQWL